MLKQIKALYYKENLNYESGYIDPFEFHTFFSFFLKSFKVDNIAHKTKYLNQNTIIFIIQLLYLVLISISLYHGVETLDIPHMTETGVYALLSCYILMALCCTKINLPQFLQLLEAMKEDFEYICTIKEEYRSRFIENHLLTHKIVVLLTMTLSSLSLWFGGAQFIVLGYFLLTTNPEENNLRPLLLPIWLPFTEVRESPLYEILIGFGFVTICSFVYTYSFLMATQITWIRQITSKADVIIWSLQDLLIDIHPTKNAKEKKHFAEITINRLRDIVMQHQSMYSLLDNFSEVFKKLLLSEQVIMAPSTCLVVYCCVLKLENGEMHIFMFLLVGLLIALFIPSYLGTFLLIKVTSICDACWDIPFWNADPLIRPYIVLIMQRSMRPLPLQAPGFEEISLQTFSRKMASAYTGFNMLRQANI